jgi:bifunctional ADP-heptose synthase (sugar kinase/adenylyltransferase)
MTAAPPRLNRSLAGVISDRFADGLDTILVVGDVTLDCDSFYEQVKERDGFPVLVKRRETVRYGCSEAIANMIRGLGGKASVASDDTFHSHKHRIIVGDKVLCRLDSDQQAEPPLDMPPAKIVLIADYAKGVVTEHTINRIAKLYAGKEIIADWHPSRPREFYHCATALKSSWDCPLDVGVPLIRTLGPFGMVLSVDGEEHRFQAMNHHALDPCGAGDMVLATLGFGRLKGLPWTECCRWASQNAAAVCRQWGSVPAVL